MESKANTIKLPKLGTTSAIMISLALLIAGCTTTQETDLLRFQKQISDAQRNEPLFLDATENYLFPSDIIFQNLLKQEQERIFQIIQENDQELDSKTCDILILPEVEVMMKDGTKTQRGGIYLKPGSTTTINGKEYKAHPTRGLVISRPGSYTHEIIHCALNDLFKQDKDVLPSQSRLDTLTDNTGREIQIETFPDSTMLIHKIVDPNSGETSINVSYFFEEIYSQIMTKFLYKKGILNTDKFVPGELSIDDFQTGHIYDKTYLSLLDFCIKNNLTYNGTLIDNITLQEIIINDLASKGSRGVLVSLLNSKANDMGEYNKVIYELSNLISDLRNELKHTTQSDN